MRLLLLSAFFILSVNLKAQEKLVLVDLDSINAKVSQLSAENDYEGILTELDKINVNDTAYVASLIRKSYYLMALERYDDAIDSLDKGLNLSESDIRSSLYQNKGVSYFKQKNYEEAINALDEGLVHYPLNQSLLYNKAVVLEGQGKIKEAVELLEQVITISPFYSSAYIKLGSIYYNQERPAQALMAFNMALMLDPEDADAFSRLQAVNNMFRNPNESKRTPGLVLSEDDKAFEELDLIISNRLALNENYVVDTDLNYPLIKQNHALLSQISTIKGKGGFWDRKFIPFYKWIHTTGNFEKWSYTVSFSIENEDYKKVIEKNIPEIKEFIKSSYSQWMTILSEDNSSPFGDELVNFNYEGNPAYTGGIGQTNEAGKAAGPWQYFNSSGRLTTKGNYDLQEERVGEWQWYNEQFEIKEINNYEAGKMQNTATTYHPNGQLNIKVNYKDGELNGEYLRYNEKGALKEKKYFDNGQLSGTYYSYFDVGEELPEFKIEYREGKVQDTAREYQSTQHIYALMPFKNGLKQGRETHYFLNDSLAAEYNYVEGKLQGPYTIYYNNGSVSESGTYANDEFVGPYKSWYLDGTLQVDANYEEGKLNGSYTYFDTDGKKYYNYTYKNGDVIDYRYYAKDGSIIKEGKRRGGEFYYTGYTPLGIKESEGLYDVEGGKKGEWKFYHPTGYLTSEGNFKDNLTQGLYTGFYPDGTKEWEGNYVDDLLSGYYVTYHRNGKIRSQGGYKDGVEQGEWHTYYLDGSLRAINFYHKGQLHGKQKEYTVDQNLALISEFERGDLKSNQFYNRNGQVVQELKFKPAPDTTLITKHYNAEKYYEVSYKNGVKHGPATTYYFDGSVNNKGAFLNGVMHGTWEYFNEDGSPQMVLNYTLGELHGAFTRFHENGQIDDEYFYHYDEPEGILKSYYKDGTVYTITHHSSGKEHGRKEFYSPLGKLQMVRFYDYGRLIGYSYLDNEGKELPMIAIENQTAEIKTYYDNGKLARLMTYTNGLLEGQYKVYAYSGQILEEFNSHNDEYEGVKTSYYLNGQVKERAAYSYGELDGEYLKFYEDGTIREKNQYKNGIQIGPRELYDESGKKIKTQQFFNNEVYEQQTF